MRRTPASLYGFLAGIVIAVGCIGLAGMTGSPWYLILGLIAVILALVELHESMP